MVFSIDTVTLWCWAKTEMAMVATNMAAIAGAVAERVTLILWLWVHPTCIIHSQGDNINYSNTIDDIKKKLNVSLSHTFKKVQVQPNDHDCMIFLFFLLHTYHTYTNSPQ